MADYTVWLGSNNAVLMSLDEKNQYLGVATSTPQYTLDVAGNAITRGGIMITSSNVLEFGVGFSKHMNAGKIAYNRFTSNFDIFGAGTAGGNRMIGLYDNVLVSGDMLVKGSLSNAALTDLANTVNWTSNTILDVCLWKSASNNIYVTDSNVTLYNAELYTNRIWMNGKSALELGHNLKGNPNCGKLGYQLYSTNLDILGVGVDGNRITKIWDRLEVPTSISTLDLTSTGNATFNTARVNGNYTLELGYGITGKETYAGKIGYNFLSTNSLEILGAGNAVGNRVINLYDKVNIGGTTLTIAGNSDIEFAYGIKGNANSGKICYNNYGTSAMEILGAGVDGSRRTCLYDDLLVNRDVLVGGKVTVGIDYAYALSYWKGAGISNLSFRYNNQTDTHTFGTNGTAWKANGSSQWEIFSDERLKTDVRKIENGLEEINKLNPVKYKWKMPELHNSYTEDMAGFIAQEVKHSFPNLVSESAVKNEAMQQCINDDKVLTLSADFQPYTIAAIKELSCMVDKLIERVTVLESKLNLT